jgi:hypothetical protein
MAEYLFIDDRVVSIAQPNAHQLLSGKVGLPVGFGTKLPVSCEDFNLSIGESTSFVPITMDSYRAMPELLIALPFSI